MLSIAICEDVAPERAELEQLVRSFLAHRGRTAAVRAYSSAEQLILGGGAFDVALLDIGLGGMNGMEAARRLREQGRDCAILFLTANRDYVYDAFDVEAVHYLIKPVDRELLWRALDRALARAGGDDACLLVSKGAQVRKVLLRDIAYCEVEDHRITLHLASGPGLTYHGKLDRLLEELDGRFFRCHRSFVINLAFVTAKTEDSAVLAGGATVMVSRRKRREFTERLLTYLQGEGL